MGKKVLIIAVVLLLLLGGWYFMSKKNGSNEKMMMGTSQESTSSSLKDLISKGVAQNCTYSTESGTGSVYVSGEKIRGDFNVTIDNKTTTSHMIVMDKTTYIWTDGQKSGIKMALDMEAEQTSVTGQETTTGPNQEFNPTANNNYKCGTWVVDNKQFTLPSNVTFTTFTMPVSNEMMKKEGMTPAKGDTSSQCSYCNALSGDDKAQCLTALKCN